MTQLVHALKAPKDEHLPLGQRVESHAWKCYSGSRRDESGEGDVGVVHDESEV